MLKHYSRLIDAVATSMYEQNEEYMYYSFEEAAPRIKAVIMQMSMAEMLEYIKQETTDNDITKFNQTRHRHCPICLSWLRLGQPINEAQPCH